MNVQPDIPNGDGEARGSRGCSKINGGDKAIIPAQDYPGFSQLLTAIAAALDVAPSELCSVTRGRQQAARARQIGIYLARTVFGLTLSDAGRLFGRDRTTAAHACRLVEDLRDESCIDRLLAAMEDDLRRASRRAR